MNHSYQSNVRQECLGELLVFRALEDVAVGEEILHAYDSIQTLLRDGRQKRRSGASSVSVTFVLLK